MKKKYYKCEFCGKEVYKEYWEGEVMVRENKIINGYEVTEPHCCSLTS